MRGFVVLALLGLLAHGAMSHSILTNPSPWNNNPSRSNPCGGGSATNVVATYRPGSTITITWRVIAGDGTGPITVSLDPNGGTSFTETLAVSGAGANPTTTGTFTASVVMSDTLSARATLQVKSSSNWFSCSTIAISNTAAPSTAPTSGTCIQLSGLTFCKELNGKNVKPMVGGVSATTVDQQLRATHSSYLENPAVFQPTNDGCSEAYRELLCAETFIPCGAEAAATACASTCNLSNLLCNLQPAHANLYECDQMISTKDIFGICSSAAVSRYSVAALVAAIATAVAAALY